MTLYENGNLILRTNPHEDPLEQVESGFTSLMTNAGLDPQMAYATLHLSNLTGFGELPGFESYSEVDAFYECLSHKQSEFEGVEYQVEEHPAIQGQDNSFYLFPNGALVIPGATGVEQVVATKDKLKQAHTDFKTQSLDGLSQ